MPGQFYSPEGDLEEHFITDHWLIDQYIGNQLWSWGANNDGQLGVGDSFDRSTPVREATSSTNWKQVGSLTGSPPFNATSSAIKTDGTLWCWGYNFYGQVGNNSNSNQFVPRQEWTSSTNWKHVTSGSDTTAAIKTDGTLWMWGTAIPNASNTFIIRSTPVQEYTSSTNWKMVFLIGGIQALGAAIKTDGTLWMWGQNQYGQLGNIQANTSPIYTFVQEQTSSTNWKSIGNGPSYVDYNINAVKTDGTLWRWGFGYGTTTPVQEPTLSKHWKKVIGSGYVVTSSGDIVNVGYNTPYSVYDSGATNWKNYRIPNVQQSFEGGIKTDGTIWTKGWNVNGGTGTNSTQLFVTTLLQEFTKSTNWKQLELYGRYSFEEGHALAIKTGIEIDTGTFT